MKKTLAVIFACLSISAFAARMLHSWFDMDIDQIGNNTSRVWPTDGSGTNYVAHQCYVTNTLNATFTPGTDYLAVGTDGPLLTIPNDLAPVNDDNYASFYIKQRFVPYKEAELPALRDDVCIGVIAVDSGDATNFWVTVCQATPCWSNTLVAADCDSPVEVSLSVSNDFESVTYADWSFGGVKRAYPIDSLEDVSGAVFVGQGDVYDCHGDIVSVGEQVSFYLRNGTEWDYSEEAGREIELDISLPAEIEVSVKNSRGTTITHSNDGSYYYSEGKPVCITYKLTNGWVFCDTGLAETSEVFTVKAGAYVPFAGRGIWDRDFGATNDWMVLDQDGAVWFRTAEVSSQIVPYLSSSFYTKPCYSPTPHDISIDPVSGAVSIDGGAGVDAPDRCHYVKGDDGSLMVKIDDCEFAITSFEVDATDPDKVVLGSVTNSYEKFQYGVQYASDVDFSTGVGYSPSYSYGTNGTLKLSAPKGDGTQRFFKIDIVE